MKRTAAKKAAAPITRTEYRMKPGKPAPKSSQGGYGHSSSSSGSIGNVVPQGRRQDAIKK